RSEHETEQQVGQPPRGAQPTQTDGPRMQMVDDDDLQGDQDDPAAEAGDGFARPEPAEGSGQRRSHRLSLAKSTRRTSFGHGRGLRPRQQSSAHSARWAISGAPSPSISLVTPSPMSGPIVRPPAPNPEASHSPSAPGTAPA